MKNYNPKYISSNRLWDSDWLKKYILKDLITIITKRICKMTKFTSKNEKRLDIDRPEPFIGVPDAAKIFAVSQSNIRKKCTENLIPHYQEFDKSPIRFKASELYQYIEKGYVKTSVEVKQEAKDFVNSKK